MNNLIFVLRILKSISELEVEINQIDASSLDNQPLTVASDLPSELAHLAGHFNNLLERIAKARTRERNFSAHAAHEMRTPLAGIHAILEQSLKQKRSPESYVERIGESLEITHCLGIELNVNLVDDDKVCFRLNFS